MPSKSVENTYSGTVVATTFWGAFINVDNKCNCKIRHTDIFSDNTKIKDVYNIGDVISNLRICVSDKNFFELQNKITLNPDFDFNSIKVGDIITSEISETEAYCVYVKIPNTCYEIQCKVPSAQRVNLKLHTDKKHRDEQNSIYGSMVSVQISKKHYNENKDRYDLRGKIVNLDLDSKYQAIRDKASSKIDSLKIYKIYDQSLSILEFLNTVKVAHLYHIQDYLLSINKSIDDIHFNLLLTERLISKDENYDFYYLDDFGYRVLELINGSSLFYLKYRAFMNAQKLQHSLKNTKIVVDKLKNTNYKFENLVVNTVKDDLLIDIKYKCNNLKSYCFLVEKSISHFELYQKIHAINVHLKNREERNKSLVSIEFFLENDLHEDIIKNLIISNHCSNLTFTKFNCLEEVICY